jgi:hypothetical protein
MSVFHCHAISPVARRLPLMLLLQIYQELMTNGPVESSFTVYSDFPTYTGGVYIQNSDQELGGHAIKVMRDTHIGMCLCLY